MKCNHGNDPDLCNKCALECAIADMNEKLSTKSGFPCYCGATDYEDAANKCDSDDSGSCCAQYMLEHFLLPDDEH